MSRGQTFNGKKILDVKFMGDDFDSWMNQMAVHLYGDKAIKKKNNLINRGLKVAAKRVLPTVWQNMARNSDTGATAMFTDLKRIKGGGWRISTPRKRELLLMTEKQWSRIRAAERSTGRKSKKIPKGYYPMSQEFGWKAKGGRKIKGTNAMGDAMESRRMSAISAAKTFYQTKLERAMKRLNNKRVKSGKNPFKNTGLGVGGSFSESQFGIRFTPGSSKA